ncbi:MAG: 2-C-methyl-D-erythritol 4-phosphate cytidylyltransferase [Opitutales bacterium]
MTPSAAILLCGGSSRRMQDNSIDKTLLPLADRPAFLHSLLAFRDSGCIQQAVIVVRDEEQRATIAAAIEQAELGEVQVDYTLGGLERQDSVFNGLSALPLWIEYAFIHDCARPLVLPAHIRELHAAAIADKAAVLAHRVHDTIKKVPATRRTLRSRDLKDVPRASLWAMETPQVFERELITDAYRRLRYEGVSVTDDVAAARRQGVKVTLVENRDPNFKLTIPADVDVIDFLLRRRDEQN